MTLRSRTLSFLAGAALLLGLLAAPSTAAEQHTATDLCIPTVPETDPLEPGPVDICLTVFRPASASAADPVPMVLHSHGWGGSRTRSVGSFQGLLDAGFGVLS
jgi:ABC-2 type transport system ATP-binding protein